MPLGLVCTCLKEGNCEILLSLPPMTQFTLTQTQVSSELLCTLLYPQVMWETLRLYVWLFDSCAEEQSHTFTHTWGCKAYSVQSGRLGTRSQHVWPGSEGQLVNWSTGRFSSLEAGDSCSATEICGYGTSQFLEWYNYIFIARLSGYNLVSASISLAKLPFFGCLSDRIYQKYR